MTIDNSRPLPLDKPQAIGNAFSLEGASPSSEGGGGVVGVIVSNRNSRDISAEVTMRYVDDDNA